jgi:hypothetical protein
MRLLGLSFNVFMIKFFEFKVKFWILDGVNEEFGLNAVMFFAAS